MDFCIDNFNEIDASNLMYINWGTTAGKIWQAIAIAAGTVAVYAAYASIFIAIAAASPIALAAAVAAVGLSSATLAGFICLM